MKLFGHPDSGHAFKVKFLLEHAGIAHEYEVIDIFKPRDERPDEFVEHARYGEVPLLMTDGYALAQSNAILMYLAQLSGAWGAQNVATMQLCREWLCWEANKIGLCLPQLRVYQRFEDHGISTGAHDWLSARYEHDIGVMEQTLSDGRRWIVDTEAPTIADFSLSGYLFLADEAKVSVPEQVKLWLKRLSSLDGWQHPYPMSGRMAP